MSQRLSSWLNLAWSSSSELLARICAIGYLVVLARHLPTDEFGDFNVLLTYFSLAVALSNLGLDRAALRDFATGSLPTAGAGTLLSLRLLGALLAGGMLILTGYALRPDLFPLFLLLAAGMFPAAISSSCTVLFQARERFDVPGASVAVSAAALLLVVGLGVTLQAPLAFFVIAYLAAEVLRAISLAWASVRHRQRLWLQFDARVARPLLSAALPFGLLTMFGLLYLRVDLLMLDWMVASELVAEYAAAYRIVDALVLLPALALGVLSPRIARLQQVGLPEAGRLYLIVTRLALWGGIGIACVGIVFADPLLRFVFGSAYSGAAPTFAWLMVALVFLFWHAPNGPFLFAGTRLRDVVYLSGAFLALNVVLNLLLIPRFGASGAAAATAISEGLAVPVFARLVCGRLGISVSDYLAALRSPRIGRLEIQTLAGRTDPAEAPCGTLTHAV